MRCYRVASNQEASNAIDFRVDREQNVLEYAGLPELHTTHHSNEHWDTWERRHPACTERRKARIGVSEPAGRDTCAPSGRIQK